MGNMHDFKLLKCDAESSLQSDLESLFRSEWLDFTFDGYSSGLPSPLVVFSGKRVIGGLAYTFYQEPNSSNVVIWLNAVFVLPEFRGHGIASQLINGALQQLSSHQQDILYAYTDIPDLYLSLNWSQVNVETELNHKVMSITL